MDSGSGTPEYRSPPHSRIISVKPRSIDSFLALYARITKDEVRQNRNSVGERLGFVGRVIHGTNPWREPGRGS